MGKNKGRIKEKGVKIGGKEKAKKRIIPFTWLCM